jgi:hypothetical protein
MILQWTKSGADFGQVPDHCHRAAWRMIDRAAYFLLARKTAPARENLDLLNSLFYDLNLDMV